MSNNKSSICTFCEKNCLNCFILECSHPICVNCYLNFQKLDELKIFCKKCKIKINFSNISPMKKKIKNEFQNENEEAVAEIQANKRKNYLKDENFIVESKKK